MEVNTVNEKIEVTIEPDDREFMAVAEERLKKLTRDEKELIKSIIEKNLQFCEATSSTKYVTSNIRTGLKVIIGSEATNLLFSILINPGFVKTVLDTLIKEGILSESSSKFISELSAEYGGIIHSMVRTLDKPDEWNGLNSNVLISDDDLGLQIEIYRRDGEILRFTSNVEESVPLSMFFIDNALNAVKKIDKEKILKFNETELDDLQKKIAELKEFYGTVKSEIEKTEQKEQASLTN